MVGQCNGYWVATNLFGCVYYTFWHESQLCIMWLKFQPTYLWHQYIRGILKGISLNCETVKIKVKVNVAEPNKCQVWGAVKKCTKCYWMRTSSQVLIGNYNHLNLTLHIFSGKNNILLTLTNRHRDQTSNLLPLSHYAA